MILGPFRMPLRVRTQQKTPSGTPALFASWRMDSPRRVNCLLSEMLKHRIPASQDTRTLQRHANTVKAGISMPIEFEQENGFILTRAMSGSSSPRPKPQPKPSPSLHHFAVQCRCEPRCVFGNHNVPAQQSANTCS